MTNQSIQIDGEAMQVIVSKAILEGIDAKQRDTLVEQAIKYLITAPRDRYGSASNTPLQDSFNVAVHAATSGVVKELIAGDEMMAKIRAKVAEAVTAHMTNEWVLTEGIGQAIGDAVAKALRGDR